MPTGFETRNLTTQAPAVSQPVHGPEPSSPVQAAKVSAAPPSIAGGTAEAPLGVDSLNRGRENLQGSGSLAVDGERRNEILLNDSAGQTATTRAAAGVSERFPFTTTDVQNQLDQVRELQQGLNAEIASAGAPRNMVSVSGEPVVNNDLAASFSVPAELRGLVETDQPRGTPGTLVMEDGKNYMHAADYYLQVAQARQEDLAAREAQLVQQLQSDPTTQRALVERQSLSARAGLHTLSGVLGRLDEAGGNSPVRVDRARIGRAEQLLNNACAAVQSTAADASLATVFPGEHGGEDVARLQHQAMEHYLGVKHPSSSEKEAAVRQFLSEVDHYLEGGHSADSGEPAAPVLAGADRNASSALTPDEKVSLVIARTLERAVAVNSLEPEGRTLFKELSDFKQVRKQVYGNVRQELRNSFEPVVKRISVPAAGRRDPTRPALETYGAVLTPANTVAQRAGSPGAFGATGVLCSDTHSPDQVPNMWTTGYTGPNGNSLFNGIRHGTLSAFGISAKNLKALPRQELHDLIRKTLPPERLAGRSIDDVARQMTSRFSLAGQRLRNEARAQAARNRAEKLVGFNLLHNKQAMDEIRSGAARVELEIPSIMLITPDRGRRILGALGITPHFDELRMTREQDRAIKELAGQGGLKIPFTDENGRTRNVTVQVKPLNFSFGVNKVAFNKLINTFSPSWRNADAISRASMERLVGRDAEPGRPPRSGLVAERLAELRRMGEEGGAEYSAIAQLADQVTQIWQSRAHHKQNNEPYALPARLALLTGKLGLTPSFNCKSGKDRTGQLDAEIKYLATCIERNGGRVPEPGAELSSEEQDLYRTIVLNSGNHEIQRMNTGHAGYKVKLSSITRRLGGVLARLQHIGQGKFTSA